MVINIKTGELETAVKLSTQIPEFESPYGMDEYEKRMDDSAFILTAKIDDTPVGFKIGYDRFHDGSFYHRGNNQNSGIRIENLDGEKIVKCGSKKK